MGISVRVCGTCLGAAVGALGAAVGALGAAVGAVGALGAAGCPREPGE